jgi:curved DNA-binding protein CbpA
MLARRKSERHTIRSKLFEFLQFSRALLVHPDRCEDTQSTQMFQRLGEAMDRIKDSDPSDLSKKKNATYSAASRKSYWKDFFAQEHRAQAPESSFEDRHEARELIKKERAQEKQTVMKSLNVFLAKDNAHAFQVRSKEFPRFFESREGITLFYESVRANAVGVFRVIVRANPGNSMRFSRIRIIISCE